MERAVRWSNGESIITFSETLKTKEIAAVIRTYLQKNLIQSYPIKREGMRRRLDPSGTH
jgi:hypothetical protein